MQRQGVMDERWHSGRSWYLKPLFRLCKIFWGLWWGLKCFIQPGQGKIGLSVRITRPGMGNSWGWSWNDGEREIFYLLRCQQVHQGNRMELWLSEIHTWLCVSESEARIRATGWGLRKMIWSNTAMGTHGKLVVLWDPVWVLPRVLWMLSAKLWQKA